MAAHGIDSSSCSHSVSLKPFESGPPRLDKVLEDFRRELDQDFTDSLHRLLVSLATIEPRGSSHLIQPWYPVAALSPALQRYQPFLQQPE